MVEAAAASGTLNTAAWASRLNRDLYATSCFPGETRFEGNEKLLSQNRPDRYPVAHAFFGPWSLAPSWPALGVLGEESLRAPSPLEGGSPLQLWIQEIRSSHGECHLPALLRKAGQEGMPRELLLPALRREIAEGRVAQEADGRLEIRSQAK